MSQNHETSQTVSLFVTVNDETVALRNYRDEGEENCDSVVVKETEEVLSGSVLTSAIRQLDIEIFIESVKELPRLWNTSLISYKDRTIEVYAWKQLSSLFNKDGEYQLGLAFTSLALSLVGLRHDFTCIGLSKQAKFDYELKHLARENDVRIMKIRQDRDIDK